MNYLLLSERLQADALQLLSSRHGVCACTLLAVEIDTVAHIIPAPSQASSGSTTTVATAPQAIVPFQLD